MSKEHERRWALIERVGDLIYGPGVRWGSRMAADIGISQSLIAAMSKGERTITDAHLNAIIKMSKRARIDLRRRHSHIVAAVHSIASELGNALTENLGSFEQDIVAGQYEADMDRRVPRAVDAELAKIFPAIDAVIAYPSADNIAALAAVRDRYRPIDEAPNMEMKP